MFNLPLKRLPLALFLSAVILLAGACSQLAPLPTVPPNVPTNPPPVPTIGPPPPTAEVKIVSNTLQPPEVRIHPGQSVVWVNQDSTPQTVTGSNFDSGPLNEGQRWERVFEHTGTFDYHLAALPEIQGSVIVVE